MLPASAGSSGRTDPCVRSFGPKTHYFGCFATKKGFQTHERQFTARSAACKQTPQLAPQMAALPRKNRSVGHPPGATPPAQGIEGPPSSRSAISFL